MRAKWSCSSELHWWNFPGWRRRCLLHIRTQAQNYVMNAVILRSIRSFVSHTGMYLRHSWFSFDYVYPGGFAQASCKEVSSRQKQSCCDRMELHLDLFSHLLFTATPGVCNQQCKHITFISRSDNSNNHARRVLNPEWVYPPRLYTHLTFT